MDNAHQPAADADRSAIRVRIAPSPTGPLHIGTARTALFNYLFAKKYDGTFVLRVEDTDPTRDDERWYQDILDSLRWLGLQWDEGPDVDGGLGPYRQSQRSGLYQQFLETLLQKGKAYKCFCTPAELSAEREAQQSSGQAPKYSGKCRLLSPEQVATNEQAGRPFSVRLKVNPQPVVFTDLVYGQLSFDAGLFGDFALTRADGSPLFILTNTIDDNAMAITHVLRGEDHMSNTAKQILLAEALNFPPAQYGHLPLIVNPDRTKMSKRKNPVSISTDYQAKGYLPEALVNYLALLGWSSGTDQEIYSLHQLIHGFSIDRVNKSPAIFDSEKLLWLNGHYLRQLPLGELAARASAFLTDPAIIQATRDRPEFFLQTISLVQERLKILSEVEGLISFCYRLPAYDAALLVAKKSNHDQAKRALITALAALPTVANFSLEGLEVALRRAAADAALTAGELLWTTRVALTGLAASPGVFEVLEVLGRDESLNRLAIASQKLES